MLAGSVISKKDKLLKYYQFNDDEKLLLETVFTYNQYPSPTALKDLAEKLVVSKGRVRSWFIHKRVLLRKETTQARSAQRKCSVLCFVYI